MANNVDCECKEWQKSAEQIFMAQIQHTWRTGEKYTGSQFKYCPWCGRLLTPRALDGSTPCAHDGGFDEDLNCNLCGQSATSRQ